MMQVRGGARSARGARLEPPKGPGHSTVSGGRIFGRAGAPVPSHPGIKYPVRAPPHSDMELTFTCFITFVWHVFVFLFYMVSRRSGRHLEAFLEPMASFSQSMSLWRAMATPFMPKIIDFYAFWVLNLLLLSMFFFENEFLVRDWPPLTGVRQMRNDILHLPDPS